MERARIALAVSISLFLFSCEKDFTVTTVKQESYAAYCILNLKDSAQYVRVNRIFLSTDDPSQYFQEPDSVNIHAEDFEVTLQPFLEGEPETIIILNPSTDWPKDEGLFSSENYKSFKTTRLLLPDRTYRLTIRNILTGYEMQAETGLLGARNLEHSFKETRYYDINQYDPERIDYEGDLNPGQWEKQVIRFLYYEYEGNQVSMKYVDRRYPTTKQGAGPTDTAEHQLSDDYLMYLAQEIGIDTSVKRKAVGIDKLLVVNDESLAIYIDYTENQSSGHFIPVLTNFDNGTGIFASRYYYTYFAMKLRKETIDTLAYGRFTKKLRFADSQGNWPPGAK